METCISVSICLPDASIIPTENQIRNLFLAQNDQGFGSISFRSVQRDKESIYSNAQPALGVSRKRPQVSRPAPMSSKSNKLPPQTPTQTVAHSNSIPGFQQNPADFVTPTQNLETGKKMFACKFCGYQSDQRSKVVRHISLKHITGGPVFNCTICKHTTKLKADMKKHYMNKHHLPEAMANAALN